MTLHTPTPQIHLPRNLAPELAAGPTFLLEAVLPGPAGQPISVPGWTVRAWPVARLGDVTLEVRPHDPYHGPAEVRAALLDAGITPLGPIRARHS